MPALCPYRSLAKTGRCWVIEGIYWISYSLTTLPIIACQHVLSFKIERGLIFADRFNKARHIKKHQRASVFFHKACLFHGA